MKLSIIDACFPIGRQSSGLAALWLHHYAAQLGAVIVPPGEADVCAVTCVDPRNGATCAQIRKRWPHLSIVAGGAGALSPYSIGLHADAVCVGNGERFIETLCRDGLSAAKKLPETWVHGETRPVEIASGFPWTCPPIQAEDGSYRVWCGRGCKKRCAFCQTGWAQVYEENPDPSFLVDQIGALRRSGKRVAYLSNDPMQHSFFNRLPAVEHGSYSLDFIRRHGIPPARQIRLGVEGVSERLRRYVGKPVAHSDLVKATAWLNGLGKSVRWFMIAGLPGENASDWGELRTAVMDWKRICAKGVLALSFTAWQPEPATPLGIAPVMDDYWAQWEAFREWFFSGTGWSNRVKLMAPAAPKTRMESAVARMGLTESQLRIGGEWGPNNRVSYPHKLARDKAASRMADRRESTTQEDGQ